MPGTAVPRDASTGSTRSRSFTPSRSKRSGSLEMSPKDRLDPLGAAGTSPLCALWGFQQVTIKIANNAISPAFQSGLRSLGALLLLLLWCAVRGIPLFARGGTLIVGLAAGVMFAAEFALIYWSLVFTEVARSILFLYTAPFFVALGAHFFVPGEGLWSVH